jgi:hypothetical protein
LYYRGQADRLAACPSTLHAWLHLPQDILNAGPSWQSWAFPMEREVQWAKAGVKDARHHPFVHMANRALRREQLKQLGHRLHISKLLDIKQRVIDSKMKNRGPKREQQHLTCECGFMRLVSGSDLCMRRQGIRALLSKGACLVDRPYHSKDNGHSFCCSIRRYAPGNRRGSGRHL